MVVVLVVAVVDVVVVVVLEYSLTPSVLDAALTSSQSVRIGAWHGHQSCADNINFALLSLRHHYLVVTMIVVAPALVRPAAPNFLLFSSSKRRCFCSLGGLFFLQKKSYSTKLVLPDAGGEALPSESGILVLCLWVLDHTVSEVH